MWQTHSSHNLADPHVRGNNVIHCVTDPQVMEIKATNSPVSYGWLTVEKNKSFNDNS